MSKVPAWFERQFVFTFPVQQYPNLCARLRGTPARLEETMRAIPEQTRIAHIPGNWSAQEEAGHLLDMEPLWLARVEDFLRDPSDGGGTLTPADLANRKTHEANHNAKDLESLLADFRAARLALLARVEALQLEGFERTLLHPRLQEPMRLVDHLYFIAEHDDHHLAGIHESTRESEN